MNTLFNLVLSFYFLLTPLYSVSAPPFPFEVEQLDGSKIPVCMFGHEYYNWMETEDGYVIDWVEDDNRLGWYYCELDGEGEFHPSLISVIYPAPIDLHISKHLREISPKERNLDRGYLSMESAHDDYLHRVNIDGGLKPLIFLVDFSDEEHEYSRDQFQSLIFEDDLNPSNANLPSTYTMSVRDYFDEISNGKQEIIGDMGSVTNWKRAKNSYSYYVDGAQGTGEGNHGMSRSAAALVVEVAMAIEDEGFDFSQYDNGNGAIDVVILIVAGKGGQTDNHFWPHMFVVPQYCEGECGGNGLEDIDPDASYNENNYFNPGGVVIRNYIVIQEKYAWNHSGAFMGDIHPIGTICHELGHVLGLPDLYDTSENDAAGIGEWGLMGSGNWQKQTSPAYMGAWSRYQLGFINPIIIDAAVNNEEILLPAESGEEGFLAMILPMDSNIPQEYLILENRQQLGADQYLEKSGLLVWHIDETITGMYPAMNSVNVNPDFYGVNLIQADGDGDLYDNCNQCAADAGDPFPGDLGITGLINPSTYNYDRDADGNIESGNESGIEIKDIVEDGDGNITFTISNPNQQGGIIGYDEGGYEGIAFADGSVIEWAGIRFTSPGDVFLSGVKTVFPSTTASSNLTYSISIWHGWSESDNSKKPVDPIKHYDGNVYWDSNNLRDGGWAYISFVNEEMLLNRGDEYYIEINYIGNGYIYPFEGSFNSESVASGKSYYRSNQNGSCISLNNIVSQGEPIAPNGDWNIRAVFSGSNEILSNESDFVPQKHEIYSNYPNPFNPVTRLSIYLANPSTVSYTVFDLRGRQIIQKEFTLLGGGRHGFEVNMKQFSSGVYFYQFTINDQEFLSQKMVLMK